MHAAYQLTRSTKATESQVERVTETKLDADSDRWTTLG